MSQLVLGRSRAWASPGEMLEEAVDREVAELDKVMAKFSTTYYVSLVSAIGLAANRVHFFIQTVKTFKVKLLAAHLLTHHEISKLATDFRNALISYLVPTFVDTDRMEDSQVMLATVLNAGVADQPAQPKKHQPRAPAAAPEGVLNELQRRLQHVARWVRLDPHPYSQLGSDDQGGLEKNSKKLFKVKKPSHQQSYQQLEEELDSSQQITGAETQLPGASSTNVSSSNEIPPITMSPPSVSRTEDTNQSFQTAFVDPPEMVPDNSPASADEITEKVQSLYMEHPRGEASHAVCEPRGKCEEVQSHTEQTLSGGVGSMETQNPDGIKLIPATSIQPASEETYIGICTSGEGAQPAAPVPAAAVVEGAQPAAPVPAAAVVEGAQPAAPVPAAVVVEGAQPANVPPEPPAANSWVRGVMSTLLRAVWATRPSVPVSAPDTPAESVVADVVSSPAVGDGNGNSSGGGSGSSATLSSISAIKPPSEDRRPITAESTAREVLEEMQRQHGIFRSALLRHGNRLWLEVKGRPDLQVPAHVLTATEALLARFRLQLRDVEVELYDARRQMERRAQYVGALGDAAWDGRPPCLAAQVGAGLGHAPRPRVAVERSAEQSGWRLLWLLCSCFACIPRKQ